MTMTMTRRKNNDGDNCGCGDGDDDNNTILRVIFLDIDGVLLPFGNDDDDNYDGKANDDIINDKEKDKENENNDKKLFPRRCIEPFRAILEHALATGGGDTKLVKLILSSTWRMRQSFVKDIIDCFVAYDLPIQEFYDTTSLTIHSLRQHEIADWIITNTTDADGDDDKNKKHQRPRRQTMKKKICWIALDDEDLLEDEKYRRMFQNHFIKTDSKVGLTMDDATKAINMWNEQIT